LFNPQPKPFIDAVLSDKLFSMAEREEEFIKQGETTKINEADCVIF